MQLLYFTGLMALTCTHAMYLNASTPTRPLNSFAQEFVSQAKITSSSHAEEQIKIDKQAPLDDKTEAEKNDGIQIQKIYNRLIAEQKEARLRSFQENKNPKSLLSIPANSSAAAQALLSLYQEPDNSYFSRSLVSVQPAVVRKSVQFDQRAAVPSILRSKKRKKHRI